MSKALAGANWNLKIGRNPAQVVAEVADLFDQFKLDFAAVCEASTYVKALTESAKSGALRKAGVKVLAYPTGDIAARETAILVRKKTKGGPGAWGKQLHDVTKIQWERDPSNRALGLHPGRKSVSAHVGWLRVLAVHTPPGPFGPKFPLRHRANLDAFAHIEALGRSWSTGLLRTRHALAPGDWNRKPDDAVVTSLVSTTGWTVTGDGIDWSLGRNVAVTNVRRPHFGGSDHWPVLFTATPTTPAPRPYARTTERGHTLDQLTNYALYAMERDLGYKPGSLTVVQGSYNKGGVSQSAGTHDGGGAVDLTPANWQAKVHAARAVGFAAWHRPAIPGVWGEHVHMVLVGNRKLSPAAQAQVSDYRNHRDGLAGHGPDNTWHPDPIPTFRMPKYAQQ